MPDHSTEIVPRGFRLMHQLLQIVLFWVAVVVVIRAAVCFPNSLLARALFWRIGPVPVRGEPDFDYLIRSARFAAGWLLQAALLFVAGWVALGWDMSLADSPSFVLLWAIAIPMVGAAALFAILFAGIRAVWIRWSDRAKERASSIRQEADGNP